MPAKASSPNLHDAQVKTVFSQPSWILESDEIELAVTQLGAHIAPVTFCRHDRKPVQPYYVNPWHDENLGNLPAPVMVPLRGDFFCLPFGGNGEAFQGESQPPHGEVAGSLWNLVGQAKTGTTTTLEISIQPSIRPGKITKRISLIDGQNILYTQEILTGFTGAMPLGHHAILKMPATEGALRVATSPFAFGMTCPVVFSDPRNREYQSLAIGEKFTDLKHVPLLWREPAEADLTAFPARRGFADLISVFSQPLHDQPAWTAAVNREEGYLWFSLKDPAVLPSTVFWIENGGRHGVPWNGRNSCLGLEDTCSYFAQGLKDSCEPNLLNQAGVRTAVNLSPDKPTFINYIQGVARIADGFDTVASARFKPGRVIFVSTDGKQAIAEVNWEFIRRGQSNRDHPTAPQ